MQFHSIISNLDKKRKNEIRKKSTNTSIKLCDFYANYKMIRETTDKHSQQIDSYLRYEKTMNDFAFSKKIMIPDGRLANKKNMKITG